jgi:hypothetical protein
MQAKQQNKEIELLSARLLESKATVYKVVADTYANFGDMGWDFSYKGTSFGITVDSALGEPLSSSQKSIADNQAKGYAYNAWSNAVNSASQVLGMAISSDTFTFAKDTIGYTLLNHVNNGLEKLTTVNATGNLTSLFFVTISITVPEESLKVAISGGSAVANGVTVGGQIVKKSIGVTFNFTSFPTSFTDSDISYNKDIFTVSSVRAADSEGKKWYANFNVKDTYIPTMTSSSEPVIGVSSNSVFDANGLSCAGKTMRLPITLLN